MVCQRFKRGLFSYNVPDNALKYHTRTWKVDYAAMLVYVVLMGYYLINTIIEFQVRPLSERMTVTNVDEVSTSASAGDIAMADLEFSIGVSLQYWPKTGDNTSNFKAYLYTNYNPTSDGGSSDTRLQEFSLEGGSCVVDGLSYETPSSSGGASESPLHTKCLEAPIRPGADSSEFGQVMCEDWTCPYKGIDMLPDGDYISCNESHTGGVDNQPPGVSVLIMNPTALDVRISYYVVQHKATTVSNRPTSCEDKSVVVPLGKGLVFARIQKKTRFVKLVQSIIKHDDAAGCDNLKVWRQVEEDSWGIQDIPERYKQSMSQDTIDAQVFVSDQQGREMFPFACMHLDLGSGAGRAGVLHFSLSNTIAVTYRTREGNFWSVLGSVGGFSSIAFLLISLLRRPFLPKIESQDKEEAQHANQANQVVPLTEKGTLLFHTDSKEGGGV